MGKRGRPVVLNACKTCKIRRVKCDGARPACARCCDTGRKCDGYLVEHSLTPIKPHTDSQELRSFKYFCERTSFEMCGHYDEEFWRSQAVQIANSHPELWHMVVAIGALHENVKQTTWTRNSPAMGSTQPVFALQQCNKAIGLLTGDESGPVSAGVMLTSCVFFMAFEMLQNNLDSSLNHLRNAWSILDAWHRGGREHATASERELVEEYLTPIIHRFSESCDAVWPGTDASLSLSIAKPTIMLRNNGSLPQTFFSLNHASTCLHNVLDQLFQHLSTCELDQKEQSNLFQESNSTLQLWWDRYQQFIQTLDQRTVDSANRRRLALLEVHYFSARVMYAARLFNDEMLYDKYLWMFEKIIEQCRRVVNIEKEHMATTEPKMTVSFDLGIIMPLYLTVSRCRDPSLRREALRLLLTSPRREGIWLSWVTALVAEQAIEIEENGLDNPQTCEDVPLQSRVEFMEMHYNPRRVKSGAGTKMFEPILQLTWTSAVERDNYPLLPEQIRTKSIELPTTADDRPGSRPYWVLLPRGSGFSHWKLLLGKKVFGPPPAPFYDESPLDIRPKTVTGGWS